jgi:ParB family chromosome partitioning protein
MKRKRSGLGRGLDALLTSTEHPPDAGGMREIPVADVQPNPFQPRRHMDEAALEELTASIRVHGLIQPLVVKPDDSGGYTLIAGERRWRAAQAAGLDHVPAVVRDATDQEMLALAIIENVQRADLDPIEAASGYRQLMDSFALSQSDVANLVGKSRTAIANTVRLLGLSSDVRELVSRGNLNEGHARALLTIEDPGDQLAMAQRAVAGGWTVRRVSRPARRKRRVPLDPDTASAVKALEAALGTRVDIRRRGAGGLLVLHFYSEEELSALYDRLVGEG